MLKWLMKGDHSCPLCRAKISEAPIRDNVFELALYDAIVDGEVSGPSADITEVEPYTWSGIMFEPDE
jgi:hypothetical protein